MSTTILSTAYLPPIQYFTKFLIGHVTLEQHESYTKQSYRNRCNILAANGPLALTIPIVKEHGQKMPIRQVKIDYDMPWQKVHFKSIESAYKNAPFYDYYIDDLIPFFQGRFEYLFDFNFQILKTMLTLAGLPNEVNLSDEYHKQPQNLVDLRDGISPKAAKNRADHLFEPTPYYQVFEERFEFVPNLSIIDLLFNEGPQTKRTLELSIKKGE